MRLMFIEQDTDLHRLAIELFGAKAGAGDAALDALKRLNPHVDFGRLGAGTVLLLPDGPGLRADAGSPVWGEAFDGFSAEVVAALDNVAGQVGRGHAERQAGERELVRMFESDLFARAFDSDRQLREQAGAAIEVFKLDRAAADTAGRALGELQDQARAELAALAKLLG